MNLDEHWYVLLTIRSKEEEVGTTSRKRTHKIDKF